MILIEKRILQDEIYFMNRQVIILCDLKIKISFVVLNRLYTIEKKSVPCVPQSETRHTHFIERFLHKLGTTYNVHALYTFSMFAKLMPL